MPRNPTRYWLGKRRSEETKEKIRQSSLGSKDSPETRERKRLAQLKRYSDPREREKHSRVMKGKNTWMKGRKHSEKTKEKCRQAALKWWKDHPEYKKIASEITRKQLLGKKLPKEWRESLSKAHKGKPMSDIQLRNWIRANHLRPTQPEKKLMELVERLSLPLSYTGDGKLIINGYCPDFVHTSEKKVVEVFGTYWHDENEIPERKWRFAEKGYDCLIIWENELDDQTSLLENLQAFLYN